VRREREKEEKVKVKEERAETAEMMLLLLYRGLWGVQSAKTRACESLWNTSGLVIFPAWLKVPDMASFKGSPRLQIRSPSFSSDSFGTSLANN
jgi:hypothetical protein